MTCIVAYANNGAAWIGGDSAGVGPGFCLQQRADQKVFRNGVYIFGFTSSFRMGQLLRYRLEPPRRHPDEDLLEFMTTDFVDAARKCLKEYGFTKVEDEVEEGGTFLVATEGQIFKIESDFQVGQSIFPFNACGCGEDIALGVMHALQGDDAKPEKMILAALKAAETFSAGVRGPFHILSIPE